MTLLLKNKNSKHTKYNCTRKKQPREIELTMFTEQTMDATRRMLLKQNNIDGEGVDDSDLISEEEGEDTLLNQLMKMSTIGDGKYDDDDGEKMVDQFYLPSKGLSSSYKNPLGKRIESSMSLRSRKRRRGSTWLLTSTAYHPRLLWMVGGRG